MKVRRILFYIFAVLGVLSAAYSVRSWFLLEQGLIGESACNINDYWNCDKVSLSQYGNWFGIPIGAFALLYWAFVVLLSLTKSTPQKLFRALFIPPVLVNAFLAVMLMMDLQLGCIVCYLNYAAWVGAILTGWNMPIQSRIDRKQLAIVWSAFAIVLAGYVGFEKFQTSKAAEDQLLEGITDDEREKFSQYFVTIKKEEIPNLSPMVHGPNDASVVVTEFSDFGCPHCAKAATTVLPELKKIKDVKFIYYPLPIDPACHPNFVGKGPSNGRCEWAKGVLCANAQGKGWEYHDKAFRILLEQHSLPVFSASLFDELSLDQKAFSTCMADKQTDDLLKSLIDVSMKLEIQGTPTFFINGRRFRGVLPIKAMVAGIVEARKDLAK